VHHSAGNGSRHSRAPRAQDWSQELFSALRGAGGEVYSNYAVGYNNVKVPAATENKIAVGNTPGAASRCAPSRPYHGAA
jgi:phosphoglycerate dehydrogenase-like enzyme